MTRPATFVRVLAACAFVFCLSAPEADAQVISQRGLVEGKYFLFPQVTPNDSTRNIADVLVREEVFVKPARWLQLAAGLDFRWNSHDEVEDEWRLDTEDRTVLRPRAAVRRLTATLVAGGFSLDVGKQFIRWGRADILNPTDRFAPRDFLNVINPEFLPVFGVRPAMRIGPETFEVVWVPQFTPSRVPLLDQRWAVVPPQLVGIPIVDGGSIFPRRSQQGFRWRHTGGRFESAVSYFDGFNHLPDLAVALTPTAIHLTRVYPEIRTYGADVAVPTGVLTLKGEAAYIESRTEGGENYVLYVAEVERQAGDWILAAGYAGEVITEENPGAVSFSPERGLARSIVGRAAYNGLRRSVAFETAVRQNGDGLYIKGEFSQAIGQHWRFTITGVALAGAADDFLGQFDRNSHWVTGLRYSF